MTLALLELVVVLTDVEGIVDELPVSVVRNMVNADDTTGGSISVGGTGDGADSEVDGFLDLHLVPVVSVEDTVGESTTGTDSKEVSGKAGSVIIDVVETGSGLIRSSEHSSHGESLASVLSHDTAKDHRGHGDGRLLAVT